MIHDIFVSNGTAAGAGGGAVAHATLTMNRTAGGMRRNMLENP